MLRIIPQRNQSSRQARRWRTPVKHSDQPGRAAPGGGRSPQTGKEIKSAGAKRAGDPIPGLDITVPQSPGGGK